MSDIWIILLGFPLGALFGYLIGHYRGYSRAAADVERARDEYKEGLQEWLRPHQ